MATNSALALSEKHIVDLQKTLGATLIPSSQVIYETTKYTFKYAVANRSVDWKHVAKLVESMKENDLHKENPIIVNLKGEIVDGQHRYEARKKLGRAVYYTVCQKMGSATTGTIQLLNTNNKNWKPKDYLDSYCSQGHKEYLALRSFLKEFPVFTVSVAIELLGRSRGHDRTVDFKEGKFVMKHEETCRVVGKWQQELEAIIPTKTFTQNAYFMRAIFMIVSSQKITLSAMLHSVRPQVRKITMASGTSDAVKMLLEVYNYHKPIQSRVNSLEKREV